MVKKRFFPEKKVDVIYNGAPLNEFKSVDKSAVKIEREKWGISPECKIVATIGRLDQQKGTIYFIEAAAKILKLKHNVTFMIVGDGPLLESLRSRCKELSIDEQVIFTGYVSNIPVIQTMTDIQVFPSLWEGTPLTLFEAMSMRLPIVSTTVDGLGEVLHDENTALLVKPYNSETLAIKIEELLSNPQKASALAKNAEEASKRFDIKHTVKSIESVYKTLTQLQSQ